MKSNQMQVLILVAAGFLSSQAVLGQMDPNTPPASSTQPNQSQQQQQPGSLSMQDSSNGPDMTVGMMRDKAFLNKVAENNLTEVQLGHLAAQKGGSEDVKSFGQKMVDDHTTLNKQIAVIADTMGFRLPKNPDKEGQAEYERLNALSGDSFDKEYLTYAVKDHHKDLRDFRMEATLTTDNDLRDEVTKASSMVREHMMLADKLARDRGIQMPGHRPPPPAAQ